MLVIILRIVLLVIVSIIVLYSVRHYIFTMNRLFARQRHPYINIDTADWPQVTVLVPAHNEEAVIQYSIEALLNVHYPKDRLKILVINDRSTDNTREIVDHYVEQYPDIVSAFHREEGLGGKGPALKDAMPYVTGDVIIVFDADYIPGRGLIKQLAAPFFDPEVGLVMGRVVPVNTGRNLLTRLMDLERSGGYQVDQQARMNMNLVPQYGGTVGGIRMAALDSVGGWLEDTLTEDTDLTYRAILKGWKSVYQNRSECYEEVPEDWSVRKRQISRWAKGHNQSFYRYFFKCFVARKINFWEKFDGILLLSVYFMPLVTLIGWIVAVTLFYLGRNTYDFLPLILLAVAAYSSIGNFAAFFEIGAASYMDRSQNRLRLLPLNFFNFLISMLTVSKATVTPWFKRRGSRTEWEKTKRYRQEKSLLGML